VSCQSIHIYLEATKGYRNGRKRLFLPLPKGREDFKACALTHWARQLIIHAYKNCPEEEAVMHRLLNETRAISTSWALFKKVQMTSLLRAAEWKTHNAFINNYMRDRTHFKDGMHILGPIDVAQHIV
jgi:tRNA G37 N-methylase Trm5